MRFPLSAELWHRLPRHPDWRYELIDGEAWLSHRPRPLALHRSTALPVEHGHVDTVVRAVDLPADRSAVAALLVETWLREDPYCSYEAADEVLGVEVARGLDTAVFGAVATDPGTGELLAAVLVHQPRSGPPTLAWLTVAREARERGLATALLAFTTTELRARGAGKLASGVSAANIPSLRWHLSRGFTLAEDPLRETLRAVRAGSSARDRMSPG